MNSRQFELSGEKWKARLGGSKRQVGVGPKEAGDAEGPTIGRTLQFNRLGDDEGPFLYGSIDANDLGAVEEDVLRAELRRAQRDGSDEE